MSARCMGHSEVTRQGLRGCKVASDGEKATVTFLSFAFSPTSFSSKAAVKYHQDSWGSLTIYIFLPKYGM